MDLLSGGNDAGTLGLGLLIAGAAAGLFRGLLGAGGGLILVPVLYHVLGDLGVGEAVRLPLAAGTALTVALPATLAALGDKDTWLAVDRPLLARWGWAAGAGALAGALLSKRLPSGFAVLVFGVIACAAALWPVLAKERWRLLQTPPRGLWSIPPVAALAALSAAMGIGGTCLSLPLLLLVGMPRHAAAAMATALAVPVCIAGSAGYVLAGWDAAALPDYSYGFVNLLAFGIAAPVMYATAAIAARYAAGVEAKRPRATFALFVVIVAVKMMWDVVG